MEILLERLLRKVKTYPSWTTNRTYPLLTKNLGKQKILVYYRVASPSKRKIARIFPSRIKLTPRFIWMLGFLKGEGPTSLGKSNYRRVTITNTNPLNLYIVLTELGKSKLFFRRNLIKGSVNVLHSKKGKKSVAAYWSKKLGVPPEKIKYYNDSNKTTPFGVCHIYISDVLLRRVLDCIGFHVMKLKK